MYNFIMYAMQLGVRIAARFDSKVRKMWRGEQAALACFSSGSILRLAMSGFMPRRSASLSKAVR